DQIGLSLTQVSLQKTVFYAHGWHLVLKTGPLVNDEFEAWRYGPVVRSLRESFRTFGRRPIKGKRAYFYDPISDETAYRQYELPPDDRKFLLHMLSFYGKLDPFILVRMTHREGSPWSEAIAQTTQANLGRIISNEVIHRHFERLLQDR